MMDVQDNEETQHADLIRHNQHHFDKESTNWDDPEVVKDLKNHIPHSKSI